MSVYDDKPWLAQYAAGQPAEITPEFDTALEMFRATVARAGDADAIRYFDGRIGYAELDRLSDALAVALQDRGLQRGDRVAVYLQNVPQFVLVQLAAWKAGCTVVNINPMNKGRELALLLQDSGSRVLVTLESLYRDVASAVVGETAVEWVITTSELDFQSQDDPRVFAGVSHLECSGPGDPQDLLEVIGGAQGRSPEPVEITGEDIAFLTYTSGTTGPPKGAMTTHANLTFNSQVYREWIELSGDDVILAVAPLFHITGLVGHIGIALLVGAPLVLMYRLVPELALETIERERVTFTIGSITVFIALMNAAGARREQLASLTKIFSGGAPIPPSTVAAFEEAFGQYIHNIYGLTETTSPSHSTPLGGTAPVDPQSGALSVGVPVYNTVVRIVGEDGQDLPAGEIGELVTAGPQVVVGYWEKPEATADAGLPAFLRTGDVGYMDADGWFYIVDRKKDQINAGGYKVWPREVEDVLYEHPAVREAAVVGVPDAYRGETVKAFVSLRPGQQVEAQELIDFCKERMAAYKYPRAVDILDDIPKTATGKLLRRELRAREQ
ncbi:class I adenylate-forming enzyme family protein [Actinomycetota bacterium]